METVAIDDRQVLLDMFQLADDALEMIKENDMFGEWYKTFASFKEIVPIHQFKSKLDANEVDNFVYYREGGVVFNTLVPAHHCEFMGGLYTLHQLKLGRRDVWDLFQGEPSKRRLTTMFVNKYDGQDRFLFEGLGFFQSSTSLDVCRHKNFEMNAQEFEIFRHMYQYVYEFAI
jgi:hypothetical protein